MSFAFWIIIIIIVAGFWYYNSNPEIKNIITNLFPNSANNTILPIYQNNTPSSIITQTPMKTYFGQPFSYYNCAQGGGDNSCKQAFLGTICETNSSSIYYGQCYANK